MGARPVLGDRLPGVLRIVALLGLAAAIMFGICDSAGATGGKLDQIQVKVETTWNTEWQRGDARSFTKCTFSEIR